MFRKCLAQLAQFNREEVTRIGRRVHLRPQFHLTKATHRMKVYQLRFKEVGPLTSKVWLALGGKMRRRRIGRSLNTKDLRYYWRPIEPRYQRLYQQRLRSRDHSNPNQYPMSLRATNYELGRGSNQTIYEAKPKRRFGVSPPPRLDFEYRVF